MAYAMSTHIRRGKGACCLIFSHTPDVSVATRLSHSQSRLQPAKSRAFFVFFLVKCRRFVALDSHCNGGTRASASFFFFAPTQGLVAVAAVARSCPESLHLQPTTTPSQPPNHRRYPLSLEFPGKSDCIFLFFIDGVLGLVWQLGYDPSEDLFGLDANSKPRFVNL